MFRGFVYNLSVKEDESYFANQIAVHNCRTDVIPFTTVEAETNPPDVKDREAEEAKTIAKNTNADTGKVKPSAVRGVGFCISHDTHKYQPDMEK